MSLYNIMMVSEEKIKSFTSINYNVSPEDLTPYILQAQDIYLQNYLGATFYIELKSQILNDSLTIANKKILDDYIGQAVCNMGFYLAIPFLKYKIFNKSILKPEGEFSPGAELNEIKFLQSQVMNVGESYMKMLQQHLKRHIGDYPSYASYSLLDGQAPDRTTPYQTGFTIPKYGIYKRNYKDCDGCDSGDLNLPSPNGR